MNDLPVLNEINKLIRDIEEVSFNIYGGDMVAAQEKLNMVFQGISKNYTYLISNAPRYATLGVEVPVEILSQHANNLNDAINNSDLVALTDTLLYEMKEGLKFLAELVRQEENV